MRTIVRFLQDERGMELPEYAVNVALIIGLTAGVITALATAISGKFSALSALITSGKP